MLSSKKKFSAALTLTPAGAFALSACSMGSSSEAESPAAAPETSAPMESTAPETMDPAANLVGLGCEAYAEAVPDGAGSV